jgi:hypothetical protein
LIFQFKKFNFTAVDRCFLPAVSRMANGELSILSNAFIMVMMGGFKEQVSRIVGGHDPIDFEEFVLSGIGNSDALPFIGEVIKDAAMAFHSRGTISPGASFGKLVNDFFVPPSAQLIKSLPQAASGSWKLMPWESRTVTRAEANAMKRCLPFNNAIYFNFLLNKLKSHVGKGRSNYGF